MKHLIALSTIAVALNAHAVITPVNPLGESGTSAELSLQGIIDSRGNSLVNINGNPHQLAEGADSWWSATGTMTASLVTEVAGYAPNNTFGIYNLANPTQQTVLFEGSKTAGDSITFDSPYDTFGFFLSNSVVGFTWYSNSTLNPGGGLDHMVSYQGRGESLAIGGATGTANWDSNSYLLGWEDLNTGDNDYNDLVVLFSNVSPASVPDTASTASLLAFAFVGFGIFARRRRA